MRRVDAKTHEFPWAVAILTDVGGEHYVPACGGALIHESWVLTAAHCGVNPRDRLVIGCADLGAKEHRFVPIDKVVPHPDFDPELLTSDLALVRLRRPVADVPPLEIDDGKGGLVLEGTATMIGWGSGALGGSFSLKLRKLDVPLSSSPDSGSSTPKGLLCVDPTNGHVGVSTGDSGGPLLLHDSRSSGWIAIGLVSDGARRMMMDSHAVDDPDARSDDHSDCDRYTLTAPFTEWIRTTIAASPQVPRVRPKPASRAKKPGRVERGL